jgi:vacuolar-type H+-ATPase subunit E/Vma4
MAETIEGFVAKLHQEGIRAGEEAAAKIRDEARQKAAETVAQAEAKAARIIRDAQAQAESTLAKSRTDLELAARDVAMRLREALGRAVREVLAAGARKPLADPEFLEPLLYDIVMQYAKANTAGQAVIQINVAPEMREKLADWALHRLHRAPGLENVSVDLKGTLAGAGFEYEARGAHVEVTLVSVVEALSELVNPNLRQMLERALAEKK